MTEPAFGMDALTGSMPKLWAREWHSPASQIAATTIASRQPSFCIASAQGDTQSASDSTAFSRYHW